MSDRRDFLKATGGLALFAGMKGCGRRPKWDPEASRRTPESQVAIVPADGYGPSLADAVMHGLRLFELEVGGKRVVLKPNLVEFDPAGAINTHPQLIGHTIEAFNRLGAREVVVAEGPGHRRDNEYLLTASGLGEILRETESAYVDLNTDVLRRVRLRSRFTDLGFLYLPETVLEADLLVSMPKLKTHHWAGITLSMKNMFGIVPGCVYGWPKNVLHWAGIEESIVDINAALDVPRFNIVDGVVGMEGNGPIQGEVRNAGVLVLGPDPVAVDATCARLMGLEPWAVPYLATSADFLGNVGSDAVRQLGSDLERHRTDFRLLESFAHLRA